MHLDEMTGALITDLQLSAVKGEYPYILGFQDALSDFLIRNRNDVTGFIDWWEEEGSGKSISMPDSQDAARILTIHKSKGLEFRMVIIPFCNWRFEPDTRNENILWVDAAKTCEGFNIPMPVKYSKTLMSSFYAPEIGRAHV